MAKKNTNKIRKMDTKNLKQAAGGDGAKLGIGGVIGPKRP